MEMVTTSRRPKSSEALLLLFLHLVAQKCSQSGDNDQDSQAKEGLREMTTVLWGSGSGKKATSRIQGRLKAAGLKSNQRSEKCNIIAFEYPTAPVICLAKKVYLLVWRLNETLLKI